MPWVNPATPNLTDYLSFLYGVAGVPEANFPSVSGVATGGSTTTLIDTTQNWNTPPVTNQWNGYQFFDITQGGIVSPSGLPCYPPSLPPGPTITATTTNSVTFAPALTTPVNVGDSYLIANFMLATTLNVALQIVNQKLLLASAEIYTLAVYNLACDRLLNYGQDIPEQTWFADMRTTLRINTIVVGLTSGISDQGTSVTLLNQEQMQRFTLQDLQTLKTPQGRQYMAFAQMVGTLWGRT